MGSLSPGRSAVIALTLLSTSASAAVIIPPSAATGPVPGTPGTGLQGNVWDYAAGDITEAIGVTTTLAPSSTFLSSLQDYPLGPAPTVFQPDTLGAFLGADAASLSGSVRDIDSIFGKIFVFQGFIAISNPTTYTFTVGSDDGFRLKIGGETVTEFVNSRPFGFSSGDASFSQPGLYPVEIFYWANAGGQSGLQFEATVFGGPSYGNSGVPGSGIVPTSVLYVPSAGSAGLALAGVLLMARRRR